jgi:integrase
LARTVQDAKIGSRAAREKLKARGKPYFRPLDRELHLGYRKGKTGAVWVMRWYLGAGDYKVETIGPADDKQDPDGAIVLDFAQAQTKARELYTQRKREAAGLPTTSGPYTVAACIADYLNWFGEHKKSIVDTRHRANAHILTTLGDRPCNDLTTAELEKWRNALAKTAKRIRTKTGTAQRYGVQAGADDEEAVRRRRASTNRTLTILKAALNRAWRAGKIASDDAWRRLQPFKEADAARVRYLTIAEAQRLINASSIDFRLLVRAALATGARYGELARLRASDFNPDSGTLHVRTSKSGKGRHIVLAEEGVALFTAQAAGRTSNALLLPKDDGGEWKASHQARPMKQACKGARIEPDANFHCLRHTYASHSIMNGAPLLVIAKNLGHTDTRMVEQHYGHLAESFVADAIRAAAPKFGLLEREIAPFTTRVGAAQ